MKLNFLNGDKGFYLGIASAKRSCVLNECDPNAFRALRRMPRPMKLHGGYQGDRPDRLTIDL